MITSLEKRKRGFMVGSVERAVVGFLVNLVKMIRKEQNLVEERMLLKELNKDADQLALLVKPTKEGRGRVELEVHSKEGHVLLRL